MNSVLRLGAYEPKETRTRVEILVTTTESDVGPRRADGERHYRGDVHRPLPLVPQGTHFFVLFFHL